MPLRFPKFTLLSLVGLFTATGVMAQYTPVDVDYSLPYTVSLSDSPMPFRTVDGKPMSFSNLSDLTEKTRNGLPVEALNLTVNAVGPGDWHYLQKLRSLRLLAIFVPDTTALALDSLLLNLADLPSLEALRISFFNVQLPQRHSRRDRDTARHKSTVSAPQQPVVPVAGFPKLRELRLSGDKIPADQLIGRFSGHGCLQRVELWGGWELPQKALPTTLNRLPNLTSLLVSGRGWQGWKTAFTGLSRLRSLNLSFVAASNPQARSHDEGNPVIKANQERHIADLNRGLTQLTSLQQLEINSVAQVEQLRLGNLPALTRLRMVNVTPGDATFVGMVALRHLTFDECFMVSLPTTVCGLPRLTDLSLVNQSYTGVGGSPQTVIPACLSRLESLTALTIANNPIRHLPLKVGDLPQLRHIQLTNCQLDTFPIFITQLQSLHFLDVRRNNIASIPDTIRTWRQLDTLFLSGNRLTKLPDFLPQLRQLRMLAIGGNNLSRLPDDLGDLDSLRQLNIGNNALMTLPLSLSRLRRLQSLTIGKNRLIELPRWLGQLDQLTDLYCDMPLTVLPSSLLKIKQLKNLFLQNTRLHGLPTWIGSLRQLKNIRLESDDIHTLPASFGRLLNLETLSIRGKKISRLPDTFGQLRKLTNLTINGSKRDQDTLVTGSLSRLPASLMNCKKLRTIRLTNQPHLDVATLFAQLTQLPALSHVDLTGDRIRTLPPMRWASLGWHSLRLTNNVLTSPPLDLAQIPDLQMLDLKNNPLPEPLNRSFHNHTMIREALLPTPTNR